MAITHRDASRTLEDRFYEKISPEPNSGCWLWDGAWTVGYGMFRNEKGQTEQSHRVAWRLRHGPIPDGMTLDHRVCKLKCCANPDHVVLCTHVENISELDGMVGKNKAKTHCVRGHPFDEKNTSFRTYRGGSVGRVCNTCTKFKSLARYRTFEDAEKAIAGVWDGS